MSDRKSGSRTLRGSYRASKSRPWKTPFAWPTVTSVADGEDILHALGLHPSRDVCGVVDVMRGHPRQHHLVGVECPVCQVKYYAFWLNVGPASLGHAVAKLADSWNSR